LKNDLDLEVTAPDGAKYRGNIFNSYDGAGDTDYNYSKPVTTAESDSVNNVENVIVHSPMAGEWTVKISPGAGGVEPEGQDFALAYSGVVGNYCASPHTRPVTPPQAREKDHDPYHADGIQVEWEPPEDWNDASDPSARFYRVLRGEYVLPEAVPAPTTGYWDSTPPVNEPITYKLKYINSCDLYTVSLGIAAIDNMAGAPVELPPIKEAADSDPCLPGISLSWPAEAANWNGTPVGYEVWRNGERVEGIPRIQYQYGQVPAAVDTPPTGEDTGTEFAYQIQYISLINGMERSDFSPATAVIDRVGGEVGTFRLLSPSNNARNVPLDVYLDWEDAPNAATYDLYFGDKTPYPRIAQGLTSSQYHVSGLEEGTWYHWRVIAFNGCGDEKQSSLSTFKTTEECTNPIAPGTLWPPRDDNDCAYTGILITFPRDAGDWNDGNDARYLREYQILRRQTGAYQWIATIPFRLCIHPTLGECPPRTYLDESVQVETNYKYKVRYINDCGKYVDLNLDYWVEDTKTTLPLPTIILPPEGSRNICPATTVRLETQTGKNSYEWFKDGVQITGATNWYYNASESGTYSVKYTEGAGCTGTSAGVSITISPCPNVEYVSAGTPQQVLGYGDGDGVIEAGERWSMSVTLANTGEATAHDVRAELVAPGMIIYYSPMRFGDIAAGASKEVFVEFVPDPAEWYAGRACGSSVDFILTSITSDGGLISYLTSGPLTVKEVMVGISYKSETGESNATATVEDTFQNFALAGPGPDGKFTLPTVPPITSSNITALGITSSLNGNFGTLHLTHCVQVELYRYSELLETVKEFGTSMPTLPKSTGYAGPGLYSLKITEKADAGNVCGESPYTGAYISVGSLRLTVTRNANCDTPTKAVAFPDQGTTAGGTVIALSGTADSFEGGLSVKIGVSALGDCSNTLPVESVGAPDAEGKHTQFVTPAAASEGWADVLIDNPTRPDICLPRALKLAPLAFTANQITQDVSVVDTYANGLFGPNPSMPLDPGNSSSSFVPMSIAYNLGTNQGRMLYATDFNSGNMAYYDASNFEKEGAVQLQNLAQPLAYPGAFDMAISRDGSTMFVGHITSGALGPWGNPIPGGVSVLTLDGQGNPTLFDVDTSDAGSPGAPDAITRIALYAAPSGPVPEQANFYPLSLKALSITDDATSYLYREAEKFPGEYVFVSGVGFSAPSFPFPCPPKEYCLPFFQDRPVVVAIIDNNARLYCDPNIHPTGYCEQNQSAYANPDYWKTLHASYKAMGDGIDGIDLGTTTQALGFSFTSGTPPGGSPALGPTLYMPNQLESRAYLFHYDQTTSDWHVVMDAGNNPLTIATGPGPTGVKVQKVTFPAPTGEKAMAYITNSGDDTVTVVDTATNSGVKTMNFNYPACTLPVPRRFTAIDARSKGDYGYTADSNSGTVSVLNLAQNDPNYGGICKIGVGRAPVRLVVQPVPDTATFFQEVRNELAFAPPADFTTPFKQSVLLADWERVKELEDTNADPQAVLANIDNFQRSVDSWTTDETVRNDVNKGSDLYRAAYLQANQPAGGR
jgi:YVTN family beta-propeller protein